MGVVDPLRQSRSASRSADVTGLGGERRPPAPHRCARSPGSSSRRAASATSGAMPPPPGRARPQSIELGRMPRGGATANHSATIPVTGHREGAQHHPTVVAELAQATGQQPGRGRRGQIGGARSWPRLTRSASCQARTRQADQQGRAGAGLGHRSHQQVVVRRGAEQLGEPRGELVLAERSEAEQQAGPGGLLEQAGQRRAPTGRSGARGATPTPAWRFVSSPAARSVLVGPLDQPGQRRQGGVAEPLARRRRRPACRGRCGRGGRGRASGPPSPSAPGGPGPTVPLTAGSPAPGRPGAPAWAGHPAAAVRPPPGADH